MSTFPGLPKSGRGPGYVQNGPQKPRTHQGPRSASGPVISLRVVGGDAGIEVVGLGLRLRRSDRWRARRQPETFEDLADRRSGVDRCEDSHATAALVALEDVYEKHPAPRAPGGEYAPRGPRGAEGGELT